MTQTHRLALPLLSALLVVLSVGVHAQKKPTPTTYPTTATFAATPEGCGICADGPLYDGIDGVSSHRVKGVGTTNGWVWDLKARRTSDPRTLTYDLSHPADSGGPSFGVVTLNDTHGQVYNLSTMAVGEVRTVRAAFHFFVNRVEYVVRFGQTPDDGSSPLIARRVSDTEFEVSTDGNGDLARLLQGNGPGAILLGIYHVPLYVQLTNQ